MNSLPAGWFLSGSKVVRTDAVFIILGLSFGIQLSRLSIIAIYLLRR